MAAASSDTAGNGYIQVAGVDDDVFEEPLTPVPRSTSTSAIPAEGLSLLDASGFNAHAFLKTSADVEIFTRDEIVSDPKLHDMVNRNIFPNREPPKVGAPEWIDYVLVSHLPLPGPATLSSAGLGEIFERRLDGGMTEDSLPDDSPTKYLSDATLASLTSSAFKHCIHRHNFIHELTVVYKLKVAHVLGTNGQPKDQAVSCYTLVHATPQAILAAADRLKWKLQLKRDVVAAARTKIIQSNDLADDDSDDSEDDDSKDERPEFDESESLEESPNSFKNRYLRTIRSAIPLSTGMTTSLSLAEAKEVVYHNFNLSRLRNYEMYDEDFETFITNVGSTKYFYPADRSFFVHDAMLSARYIHRYQHKEANTTHDDDEGDAKGGGHAGYDKAKVGIEALLSRGKYETAFPPHLPDILTSVGDGSAPPSATVYGPTKPELAAEWATYKKLWTAQPLDKIRQYFGTKIGFYYLWLEYYTVCLFIPSMFGLFSLLYGLATFSVDPGTGQRRQDVAEFCDNERIMCGLCSKCETWKLSDFCRAYEGGYIVDNEFSVPFSFAVAIWSTVTVDAWQRVRTAHILKWNLSADTEEAGSQLRPQFKGVRKVDPLSGRTEQVTDVSDAFKRFGVSISVMFTMLGVVVAAIIGTIVYRIAVKVALASSQGEGRADLIAVLTAAVINLIVILILNEVYKALAIMLTDYENHKTRKSWNAWLVFKVFLFQFVNTNASLFYIAIIKPLWVHMYSLNEYGEDTIVEQCAAYGCKLELALNLLIIMGGKQIVQSIGETYVPVIIRWFEFNWQAYQDKKVGKMGADKKKRVKKGPKSEDLPWEHDETLARDDDFALFDDFNELALQFGFCTLYTTALPITPILALVNNIFEVRVDAKKSLNVYQRATPGYATNINVWRVIFRILSFAGVLMTGLVMAVTSDFIPKIVYQAENHGDLDGFINSTMWFHPSRECWVRTFWVQEDIVTCVDPSIPNCINTGPTQVGVDQVTALSYHYWVARLIFIVVFEHIIYTTKIVLEAVIADVSPNTERIQEYHDTVTTRVMRHDDLKKKNQRKSGADTMAPTSPPRQGSSRMSFLDKDPLVLEAPKNYFDVVANACHRHRYHDQHHLLVRPLETVKQQASLMGQVRSVSRGLSECGKGVGKGIIGTGVKVATALSLKSPSRSTASTSSSGSPAGKTMHIGGIPVEDTEADYEVSNHVDVYARTTSYNDAMIRTTDL